MSYLLVIGFWLGLSVAYTLAENWLERRTNKNRLLPWTLERVFGRGERRS